MNEYRYQYGDGCLLDQIFGQTLAHIVGLGHVLPAEHIRRAIYSVYKHNFLPSFKEHHNLQRTYVLNEEPGLLLCSWPDGNRPKLPFPYADEVWTGIEYQVATCLLYEGFIAEGLTLVKALRSRQDGVRRNPFNEVECGNHYARSLASYGILLAASGFGYDIPNGKISFSPAIQKEDFHCFFSAGNSWGMLHQTMDGDGEMHQRVEVLYGDPDGVKLEA